MKDDSLADVNISKSKVTCRRSGLSFYITDYIPPKDIFYIYVGLWPDGKRYETSIGIWPVAVRFYYKIKVIPK